MVVNADSEAATKDTKNNVLDKVLVEFKEDLEMSMAFCTALKRELHDIYTTAFPNDDVGATKGELTQKLEMVSKIPRRSVTLEKGAECRFVDATKDP